MTMQPACNEPARLGGAGPIACVFFGGAGAGKSSLTNQLIDGVLSGVSHDITGDGTTQVQVSVATAVCS